MLNEIEANSITQTQPDTANELTDLVRRTVEDAPDDNARTIAVQDVLLGLANAGELRRRKVHFPGLHRILGHVVVGDMQFFIPKNPQDYIDPVDPTRSR